MSGKRDVMTSEQPIARPDYVRNMGGVDVADQRLSSTPTCFRCLTRGCSRPLPADISSF